MVQLSDLGEPEPCITSRNGTVQIRVIRNENAPLFTKEGQYEAEIDEDARVDSKVVEIDATDKDSKVFIAMLLSIRAVVMQEMIK